MRLVVPEPFAIGFSLLGLGLGGFTVLAICARRYTRIPEVLIRIMLIVLIVKLILIPTVFEQIIVSSDELSHYHAEAVLDIVDPAFRPSTVYSSMLSVVYRVLGPYPQVGKLLNALFLSLTAILLWQLCRVAFDERTGIFAFLFIQLTPQLAIWTTPLLRESLGILLSAAVLLCLALALQRKEAPALPLLIGLLPLALAYALRAYIGLLLVAVYAIVAVITVSRSWNMNSQALIAWVIGVVALLMILNSSGMGMVVLGKSGEWLYRPSILDTARQNLMPKGVEIYEPTVRIDSISGILRFLPKAYQFVLFAPFPSHIEDQKTFGYFALSVLEYPLILLAAVGAWVVLRKNRSAAIPLLLFTIATITLYGLIDPVLGGIVRHRMQAWPGMLVLAAVATRQFLDGGSRVSRMLK